MDDHNQVPGRPMSAFARLEEVLRDPDSVVFEIGSIGDKPNTFNYRQLEDRTYASGPLAKKNITCFLDGFEVKTGWPILLDAHKGLKETHSYFELYLTTANMRAHYARPKKEVPSTELK